LQKALQKAVILVGGEGTRLRPLTNGTPKPMLPVLNHPFLEHTIHYLRKHGIVEIVLALSYMPEVIKEHFGDGRRWGVRMRYTLEDSPLGTAGAVKNAEEYLDSTFVVLNGDIFTSLDIANMFAFHRKKEAKATIALTWVDNPYAFGVVETDNSHRIQRFVEKPAPHEAITNWINAGVYILEPEVLHQVPQNSYYMFERGLFPRLLELGATMCGYQFWGQWLDMGTAEKYLDLNCDLLLSADKPPFIGSPVQNEIYCAGDAIIHPSAQIEGPVVVAGRSRIGPGVRIKGPVVLGSDCDIADGAVLEMAVLWHNVTVKEGSVLKKCVVGNGAIIESGEQIIGRVISPHCKEDNDETS
jgi:mannose-1-phosphate guanylyltransferase